MTTLPIVLIMLCALCGFSIALYIHFKKQEPKPLVCPIGHSCDPVVHSDYSRIMNVPVEILGVLYYAAILLAYSLLLMYPGFKALWVQSALLAVSGIAFIFSAYLTAVQAFILKEWCSWCLFSASLCVIIFAIGLWLADISLLSYVQF